MRVRNDAHLQEEQILWAVIDEQDLGEDAQRHLQQCQICKGKVEQFRDELHEFGQIASQSVPPFNRFLKLPAPKPAPAGHYSGWLPFFGAAAMAAFILFFYFMDMHTTPPPPVASMQSQENLLEDETLMREIAEMVEYPLPEDLYEISGEYENNFDDDFLQFIVPDTDDDFQSELIIQGGIRRC